MQRKKNIQQHIKKHIMKKHILTYFYISLSLVLAFTLNSCKDDNPQTSESTKGDFKIEFEHVWGPTLAPFVMNTQLVHPMSADTLTVNLLKYYVSNIVLYKADGSTFKVPESYYLISPEENIVTISNVPTAEYTRMEFLLGVDSVSNFSGLQEGALNPSNGMFWSWSTGYIFTRIEGKSPQSPSGVFLYHLGGYQSPYNAINKKSIAFTETALNIKPTATPQVHLTVNVAKFWHGPVKIADLNVIHNVGDNAVSMSRNFADGFLLDHVHQ
jgi:hypothetical protein